VTRVLLLVVIAGLLVTGCGGQTAHQIPSGPVSASGSSGGVRITLSLPRSRYPADALIRARLEIRNLTHRTITAPGTSCTQNNPYAEDVSLSGLVTYPNGVRWITLIPTCGATTEDLYLGPGISIKSSVYVLARDPLLRGVMIFRNGRGGTGKALTAPIKLQLGSARPPRVRFSHASGLAATLTPQSRPHGSLVYLSIEHCYPGSAPYDYLGVFWTVAAGRTIRPECARPSSWRAIAGWVGSSVATIRFPAH